MDLGTTLQTARERRGFSLEYLAQTTKIPIAHLRAFEANEFHKVPQGIFARGFLRAYAREVGLDAAALVEQFQQESGELAPAPIAPAVPVADTLIHDDPPVVDSNPTAPGWGYLAVVAALVLAIVGVNRWFAGDPETVVEEGTAAVATAEPADVVAAAAPAATREPAPVGTSGESLRFEIAPQGPCWVEAVVDGRRVVYRLMQGGERQSLVVERELVLNVGDPGTFAYTINGKPGEPIGRPGLPTRVRFTTDGTRTTPIS